MTLFIDADACPVIPQALRLAKESGIPAVLVCDVNHQYNKPGAQVIVCDQGADSADLVLVNRLSRGDLVVTQDYGVAALALSKSCRALNQDGMEYTNDNLDALLFQRFLGKKVRAAGGRTKGPSKRTARQNQEFEATLRRILKESTGK